MDSKSKTRWGWNGLRALSIATLLLGAMGLAACGGAGTDDSERYLEPAVESGSFSITTTSVPAGSSGVGYDPAVLSVAGAQGPITWAVTNGDLPPGMTLTDDGRLIGLPSAAGYYEFTAYASDGVDADQQDLAVAIDQFGVSLVSGLTFGDAWSGQAVQLRGAGFTGPLAFELVSNDSGGRFEQIDGSAGSSAYVPGRGTGQDVIRITDTATDQQIDIRLNVTPNPTEEHVARFGSSDVWYLDLKAKQGAHPYASDLQAGAVRLGLRQPGATDAFGSETDRVADLLVRVSILRRLNEMFLRRADGSAGAAGFGISFPLDRPGAGYAAPAPGRAVSARVNQYSVMCVCDQQGNLSALGMAMGDSANNAGQENNSPGAAGQLGVFVNYIAESVERTYRLYGDDLRRAPVDANDTEALKALLYGLPNPGGRYELLRYQVDALAESVAYIAAHEIGHSLGLAHTSSYTQGSIMNTVAIVGPGAEHYFLPEDLARLQGALPGPGRGGVVSAKVSELTTVAALLTPEGGIHVCSGTCHEGE